MRPHRTAAALVLALAAGTVPAGFFETGGPPHFATFSPAPGS